ncbi:ABC transporter permease [Lachnospiraceae bacterium 45-W7]
MRGLMKAELFKLKKSRGFQILLLVNVVITLLMAIFSLFVLDSELTGFHIMKSCLAMVLYHAYIGYLLAAVFCCGEFSNRTFAMSLLCGYSRTQVFLAKAVGFFLALALLFAEAVGLETVFFSMGNGFGLDFNLGNMTEVFRYSAFGLAGCLTMGAVMLLVAVTAKKAMITLGAGIGGTYVLLYMETTFRDHPLPYVKYLYTYQIRQIFFGGDTFSPGLFLAVLTATFTVSCAAAVFIFEKSELK